MIAEAFLIAALALPASYSGSSDITAYSEQAVFKFLIHTIHKEYSDDYKHKYPIILLVDDSANLVDTLRASNLNVWAMSPFSSMSRWQFRGDLYESPIRREKADIAYLAEPLRRWKQAVELMAMTKIGGYMIVDLDPDHTYVIKEMRRGPKLYTIDAWLKWYGWEHLPFTLGKHSIYRKGTRRSA